MAIKGISVAGQTAGEAAWSIFMFALSIVITAAFVYLLVTDPGKLTSLWEWTRSLNIFVQGLVWLLFLPWMVALLFMAMPWLLPIKLVLVAGALGWTNWLLYPWK